MSDIGKTIIGIGLLITLVGAIGLVAGRLGLHRLPGDIVVRRGNFTFAFPIVTCVMLSVILTIVLNLIFRRR
jgi:hypothetical protein